MIETIDALCDLFIDPGFAAHKHCACALFDSGLLVDHWQASPKECRRDAIGIDRIIVEKPQKDDRTISSIASTLELAWQGAMVAGIYAGRNDAKIIELTPSEWKGSLRKPTMHAKTWKLLTPAERKILGGAATLAVIERAVERGALERWRKPGGEYYPRKWTMADTLDAVSMGIIFYGR